MSDSTNDPQDKLIRTILVSTASAAVLGLFAAVLVVAALISANWNFMEWME
ncbi:MAG: hypothetical protein ACKOAS_00375 [Verrucomicrobiota bacterium]